MTPEHAFAEELRKKLREIDWIETPYLQMMMDEKDEWLENWEGVSD